MVALRLIAPPAAYVLSAYELKQHARIDFDDEDLLVSGYLQQAHEWLEEVSGRAIVTQTWEYSLDCFPGPYETIEIPKPPLQQVLSLQYVDDQGTTQTLATSKYQVDTSSEPGRIKPAYGECWPWTLPGRLNAVTIQFVAGSVTPFTANPSTDVLTAQGRTFANDDTVRLSTTDDGELPAGLTPATQYYVVSASGSTLQLAATQGGAAIDFTDSGSPTMFIGQAPNWMRHAVRLLGADAYMNREETTPRDMRPIPMGVRNLLWANRVWAVRGLM